MQQLDLLYIISFISRPEHLGCRPNCISISAMPAQWLCDGYSVVLVINCELYPTQPCRRFSLTTQILLKLDSYSSTHVNLYPGHPVEITPEIMRAPFTQNINCFRHAEINWKRKDRQHSNTYPIVGYISNSCYARKTHQDGESLYGESDLKAIDGFDYGTMAMLAHTIGVQVSTFTLGPHMVNGGHPPPPLDFEQISTCDVL